MNSKTRFAAIEGLRGWLAWAVVCYHIASFSGVPENWYRFFKAGGLPAVLVFMIVSGFVITHLLIKRPEPYGTYLVRRFMRIFPLFAVTCIAGYYLHVQLLAHDVFGDQQFASDWRSIVASSKMYFWQHVVAHLTMLHGAISNNLLPWSDYAFNSPAWSISVEWQFYLLAPLILLAPKYPLLACLTVVLIGTGHWLFKGFGSYHQPSFIFDPIGYFAVGIVSRLFYPTLAGKIKNLNVILASIVLFYALVGNGPLAVWSIVYLGFILHPSVNGILVQGYRLALESHLATYFGSRSYSIYLAHFPVIIAVMWLWITLFSSPPGFLPLLAMVVPATILTAEILYRVVEIPSISLGSRWARRSMSLERYDHDVRALTEVAPLPKGDRVTLKFGPKAD